MNILYFKNKYKTMRAFTLLEVLASLSIVTLVILGPLTSAINSSSYSSQSKDLMVSIYLAEEALELLHYQYDTLYIACTQDRDACDVPTNPNEKSSAKAWRLFKERLADTTNGSVSCFAEGGCAYDFLDMMNATSSVNLPKKYDPEGLKCPKLSMVQSAPHGELFGINTSVRNYYVCSSIDQEDIDNRLKDNHFNVSRTNYSRSVFVESRPTFTESAPPFYQDDLIVTATVSFRRTNGMIRTIRVTDFFHAR